MGELSIAKEVTMSSLDFLRYYINPAREAAGESAHANNKFIAKVMDELDLDMSVGEKFQPVGGGTPQTIFTLTYDQMMLVGMRESKAVRKAVLAKLKQLEQPKPALPQTYLEALESLVAAEKEKQLAIAERDEAIKTKAHIGSKREASVMGKLSAASKRIKSLESKLQDEGEYLSVIAAGLPQKTTRRIEKYSNGIEWYILICKPRQTWRILKELSEEMGKPVQKVTCPRYGEVNGYHVDVIEEFKKNYK